MQNSVGLTGIVFHSFELLDVPTVRTIFSYTASPKLLINFGWFPSLITENKILCSFNF